MGIVKEKIEDLKARQAHILEMGGEKLVAKHKEKGKLTARERIGKLFDKGTFREVDMFVKHRCVNFGMEDVDIPSDGVITGHGLVEGRPVFAFAQDFTSRAGSLGEMQAKKICKVMDMALKAGVPFVGVLSGCTDGYGFESYPRLAVLDSVADLPSFLTLDPEAQP